jgi:hypothetical protein
MIAHGPLRRSGRAELPHPAPTLGEDAETYQRIRLTDRSRRKPPRDITPHAAPRQMVTLTATAQDRAPQVSYCFAESAQRRAIHGHPVIRPKPNIDTGGEFTPPGTEARRSGSTWFSQGALRRSRMRFSTS